MSIKNKQVMIKFGGKILSTKTHRYTFFGYTDQSKCEYT